MAELEQDAVVNSEETEESYSLASILAEYKTEAFIRSERRLSSEELREQAEAILAEMRRSVEEELTAEVPASEPEEAAAEPIPAAETPAKEPAPARPAEPEETRPEAERPEGKKPAQEPTEPAAEEKRERRHRKRKDKGEKPNTEPQAPEPKPEETRPSAEPDSAAKPEKLEKAKKAKRTKSAGPAEEAASEPAQTKEPPAKPEPEPEEDVRIYRRESRERPEPSVKRPEPEKKTDVPETEPSKTAPVEAEEETATPENRPDIPPEFPDNGDWIEFDTGAGATSAKSAERLQNSVSAAQLRREAKRNAKNERLRKRAEAREAARREAERAEKREITPEEASERYASGIASLQSRTNASAFLFILLTLFSLSAALGFPKEIPEKLNVTVLAVTTLVLMALGVDLLLKGIMDMIAMRPGFETLIFIACILSEADAAMILAGKERVEADPYCLPAAAGLVFALWGMKMRRVGFRDTFRAMKFASVPTVVTAEDTLVEEGTVLDKHLGSSAGFLRKCTAPDRTERVFHAIMPYLFLILFLAGLTGAYLSGSAALLHVLSGLTAAACAFSGMTAFPRMFSSIANKLITNGAALAGWGGAKDFASADGMLIRDLDVYPENTILLNGMKVLSGTLVEKVVAFTGSVILASGSGLKRAFGDLMRQYAAPLYHVEHFDCSQEGGISAFIAREQVLVGTSAFMNLNGVRVPSSVEVGGAVYTAIDGELCGVFVVHYTPVDTVQNALLRFETSKLKPIFAIRDFNINPAMMIRKFRLMENAVRFLPPETRYTLSMERESEKAPSALLSREGLWHYWEVSRQGRRMFRSVNRALVMTVLGIVFGILLTFLAFTRAAWSSVSPFRLFVAMLLWYLATILVSDAAEGD